MGVSRMQCRLAGNSDGMINPQPDAEHLVRRLHILRRVRDLYQRGDPALARPSLLSEALAELEHALAQIEAAQRVFQPPTAE